MNWFLIYTKQKQEFRALENLTRQGFECYLPTLMVETIQRGALELKVEALFKRYMFIKLGETPDAKGWGAIRSTLGVSRLVSFGVEAAKASDMLIETLRSIETTLYSKPRRLFEHGEKVEIKAGPFAGLEGIYQLADGEMRSFVLIELLSKQIKLPANHAELMKKP
jgi:transcriptional antiterminator RfaH